MTEEIKYSITDAEWKVMKILWLRDAYGVESQISLGTILDDLKPGITWKLNTVKTLLVRLAEKNIVNMEKIGQYYKYYAVVRESDCIIQETKSFVDKIFGGSTYLMFSTLLKEGNLSEKEKQEILQLIKDMKE